MSRNLAAVCAVPLMLGPAAACGTPDPVVPPVGGTTMSVGGDDRPLRYARCMRENGVPVADPLPGGAVVDGPVVDGWTDAQTMRRAVEACRPYDPGGGGARSPATAERGRAVARCMRDSGVENFPDPDANGAFSLDGSLADDPQFERAGRVCARANPAPSGASG
jgi:hypothetical protein